MGLLSPLLRLSNELAGRSSVVGCFEVSGETSPLLSLCCDEGERLSLRSPSGTESPIVGSFGLTAEVSMVMVGALCRRAGPGEGVFRASTSLSAMGEALQQTGAACWGCTGGGRLCSPSDGLGRMDWGVSPV